MNGSTFIIVIYSMKGHKYFAHKVDIDGMKFDSKKEYNDWLGLCELEKEGKISNLERQVKIEILPRQTTPEGKFLFHPLRYVADFRYTDKDGKVHVVDSKGYKTEEYKLKKKMVYFRTGILIEEI